LPEASKKREMTLYLLGEMYYKKSPLRNYKKAYRCFKTLINEYPFGKYTKIAIKKMKYLEENYINYY
jgi:outer membrane protein assembly factor BamD (BamD/ComL family)